MRLFLVLTAVILVCAASGLAIGPLALSNPLVTGAGEIFRFRSNDPRAESASFLEVGWDPNFGNPGVNGTVRAIAVDTSGNVYVVGDFTMAGGSPANRIARWDGETWTDLGANLGNCLTGFGSSLRVNAIAISGSRIYIGGAFGSSGFLCRWTGSGWSADDFGRAYDVFGGDGTIEAIAISGSDVYVRGFFTAIGNRGLRTINMAKWDGTDWSLPVRPVVAAGPLPLVAQGGQIYASEVSSYTPEGTFIASYRIGRLVGTNWEPVGGDVSGGGVTGIAFKGNEMFVAGSFTSAGGVQVDRIAKWNGSEWSTLGTGLNNTATAIAVHNNDVYVAGTFTQAGGQAVNRIARWDGTNWYPLGTGVNSTVNTIVSSNGKVYVGGTFLTTGGFTASRIGRWTPTPCIGAETISGLQLNPNGGYLGDAADGFSTSLGFLTSTDSVPTPCTPTPMPSLQTVVGVDFFFPTIASPAPTAAQPNRWLYNGSYEPNFEGKSRTVTLNYSDGVNSPRLIEIEQQARCVYRDNLPEVIYMDGFTTANFVIDISPACSDMEFSTDSTWIAIVQVNSEPTKRFMKITLDPLPPGIDRRQGVIQFGAARHLVIQTLGEDPFSLRKLLPKDYMNKSRPESPSGPSTCCGGPRA